MAEEKMLTPRQKAEMESELPYSFKYKITRAFWGKQCPVCGIKMTNIVDKEFGFVGKDFVPTIQHNVPVSKGGKHELGNISVICKRCNVSLQNTETDELNAKEVIEVWQKLSG